MPGEYLTINESGQGEYVEKKSRLIAQAAHVESEEEAKEALATTPMHECPTATRCLATPSTSRLPRSLAATWN